MKASTLFLALCTLACTAAAQPATSPETSDMQPKIENGVTYLCGGVGLDESTAMKQAARNYDLMSTFAAQDGSYLADVNVDILGKGDTPILQTTCDGPMLLVKVPQAGAYRIRAPSTVMRRPSASRPAAGVASSAWCSSGRRRRPDWNNRARCGAHRRLPMLRRAVRNCPG